ncbi:MAG: hypothetical protein ACREJC_16605 [Tepidisphaeraceae bacterium]
MPKNPLHSAASCEHGTPADIVSAARLVMGGIDFDACSNWYWNEHVVHATRFAGDQLDGTFTDGLAVPWQGRVLCNPPGAIVSVDKDGKRTVEKPSQVRAFWERATRLTPSVCRGEAICWVGYSLEQLQNLQQIHAPTRWPTCFFARRVNFLRRVDSGPPVPQTAPMHGSFVTLLSLEPSLRQRFAEVFRRFGHVSEGTP